MMMMMRVVINLGLILSAGGIALAQVVPQTDQRANDPAASLAVVRTVTQSPGRVGMQADAENDISWPLDDNVRAVPWPSRKRSPAQQIVSVNSLRHRIPKEARRAFERALRLTERADAEGAVKELDKAIELDPDFAAAHHNLGVQYAWLGRYQEAEAQFRRTIELMPESPVGHANLALVLAQIGNPDEAEFNLRRAVQLAPDDRKAHLLLGRLLLSDPNTREEGQRHLGSPNGWAVK
jgi:tetratricopeptide (TPR) repeat protein